MERCSLIIFCFYVYPLDRGVGQRIPAKFSLNSRNGEIVDEIWVVCDSQPGISVVVNDVGNRKMNGWGIGCCKGKVQFGN